MNPKTFMLIAGEASGDLLAAELVSACAKKFHPPPSICHPRRFLRRAVRACARSRAGLRPDAALGHRHFRRAEKLFQVPAAVQPTAEAGD